MPDAFTGAVDVPCVAPSRARISEPVLRDTPSLTAMRWPLGVPVTEGSLPAAGR